MTPDDDTHDASDTPQARAALLARQLHARGHVRASAQLEDALARHQGGNVLLEALREACQSVLTFVEAIDPSSFAAIEEMRLDLDRRLSTGRVSG